MLLTTAKDCTKLNVIFTFFAITGGTQKKVCDSISCTTAISNYAKELIPFSVGLKCGVDMVFFDSFILGKNAKERGDEGYGRNPNFLSITE